MKKRSLLMYTLCVCTALVLGCTPDEVEGTSPDGPNVEEPDVPVPPPTPDEPDEPTIPDDDEGSSGKPGEDEPADYTEQSKEIVVRDFQNKKDGWNLSDYQMIDADGLDGNNSYVQTWHEERTGLSSSMFDKDHDHDHWLITEGFRIDYPKVVVSWTLLAEVFEEWYEVYVSTSPDKNSFTKLIYSDKLKAGRIDSRTVDRILDGYQGQTIYLAFRHNTSAAQKMTLTLEKLTIYSFPYDEKDLVAEKMWLTYPESVGEDVNVSTGTTYFPGLKLNASIAIKNLGLGLRGEDLHVSYEYGGKKVSEVIPNLYLPQGEIYVHQFSEQLLAEDTENTKSATVTVQPLSGETRVTANSRHIPLNYLSGDPHYHILFEKVSKTNCGPCGKILYQFDQIDEKYPNRTIGVTTMWDTGLNYAGGYQGMIADVVGKWGATPIMCYDRTASARSIEHHIETIMEKGLFGTRMFPPFAVDVTHEFIADTMFVYMTTTCLADMEDEDYRITALVLEDNIKGYPQAGVSNPVHNHILRAILGDNWRTGVKGVIPANAKANEKYKYTFKYTIPEKIDKHTIDRTQLYAVASVIDCLDKNKIVNSNKTLKEATKSRKRRR